MSPATTTPAPPPAPPAPPPPPAQAAVWSAGAPTPAPPNSKRKAGVIVAAAVGTIALVGGGFALINVVKGDPDPAPAAPTPIITTVNPGTGPATPPSTPTVPGPTTPGTTPPPTQPPPTSPPVTQPPTGGDIVELAGGVLVPVLDGWEIGNQDDTGVFLSTDGAEYRVVVLEADPNQPASAFVGAWLQEVISQEVADLAASDITDDPPPTASVVSSASASFQGNFVTAQGSAPVEGVVLVYVRGDGVAVVVDTLNLAGAFADFVDDYNLMIEGMLSAF